MWYWPGQGVRLESVRILAVVDRLVTASATVGPAVAVAGSVPKIGPMPALLTGPSAEPGPKPMPDPVLVEPTAAPLPHEFAWVFVSLIANRRKPSHPVHP